MTGDTMIFMTSSKEEKYRIEITEDSLFGGSQVQNKQEALKYKPKILLPMKIEKLTKDSLVFGHWESGKKKIYAISKIEANCHFETICRCNSRMCLNEFP